VLAQGERGLHRGPYGEDEDRRNQGGEDKPYEIKSVRAKGGLSPLASRGPGDNGMLPYGSS
jgi:hypothetical protein